MRRQFTKAGRYRTKCGFNAVVVRLRQLGVNQWELAGAIKSPENGVLYLHYWSLYGDSQSGQIPLDLLDEGQTDGI